MSNAEIISTAFTVLLAGYVYTEYKFSVWLTQRMISRNQNDCEYVP